MEHTEIVNGQGTIQSALKRIGVTDSNVFCLGYDPLLQSGVIVSQGKVVSSKILNIQVKPSNLMEIHEYTNKVDVTFVNSDSKQISSLTFNILNDTALVELVSIIKNNNKLKDSISNLDKNINELSEKVSNIDSYISTNEKEIESIPELKRKIDSLQNHIDRLEHIIIDHIQYTKPKF